MNLEKKLMAINFSGVTIPIDVITRFKAFFYFQFYLLRKHGDRFISGKFFNINSIIKEHTLMEFRRQIVRFVSMFANFGSFFFFSFFDIFIIDLQRNGKCNFW